MGAFSANLRPFTGDSGVLVNLNVSVADNFTGGDVEISNVRFIDSQDQDVKFDSTSTYFGVKVTGITLSETELNLTKGKTATLTATIIPDSATDKTVTWTSSDEGVATVSADGEVSAVELGEAVITATCGEVSVTCKVYVVPTPAESVTISETSSELKVGETISLT
ncbi:MAG: Ig-like domain-containing protein, partial [Muribaculaceae bacterium]|nr:Ig-like domain-containing protein [Muribaculaceae bacterium]